jgi:hypothetical protein
MGVALLSAQTNFLFRIDPELITWNYSLNTHVDNTYGGKVIQLLSVSIQQMTISCMSGAGGRPYLASAASFFKDMMIWQRNTGQTATFTYPPRGYHLKVYALSFNLADELENVVFPFTMGFQVQEDMAGVVSSQLISAELQALQAGIGYTDNQFNDPGIIPSNVNAPPSTPDKPTTTQSGPGSTGGGLVSGE